VVLRIKAQDSVVALMIPEISMISMMGQLEDIGQLTRKVPQP
jgi:hypothetical protein